jgi:hypothetical protein
VAAACPSPHPPPSSPLALPLLLSCPCGWRGACRGRPGSPGAPGPWSRRGCLAPAQRVLRLLLPQLGICEADGVTGIRIRVGRAGPWVHAVACSRVGVVN